MKYYFSLILTLASFVTFGQVVMTQPASFTAETKVKILVDVTGTAVDGIEPLYIWTWSPNDPPIPGGNGTWDNSNDSLVLHKEATNLWSITMIPTKFYKTTAAKITQISFLVKAKNGGGTPEKKTKDLSITVDPIAFKDSVARAFPSKFTENDIVGFYYNRTLDKNTSMQTLDANSVYLYADVKVKDAAGNIGNDFKYAVASKTQVGTVDALKMNNVSDNLFRLRMIPRKFFNVPDGEKISQIRVQFRSKDGTMGSHKDAGTSETNQEVIFNIQE